MLGEKEMEIVLVSAGRKTLICFSCFRKGATAAR